MKRFFLGGAIFLFLALLVLFPESCALGAKSGLLLWFQVILPNLLPFLVVSSLLLEMGFADALCRLCHPLLGRILPIGKNACYPIVIGLLSGYPVGAKACCDMVRDGRINRSEGQFLLACCNNASPMFLIGFLATDALGLTGGRRYLPWLSLVLSGMASAFLLSKFSLVPDEAPPADAPSERESGQAPCDSRVMRVLDQSILGSFEVLAKVGGYVILFSILANAIRSFPFLPALPKLILVGALEITTGIEAVAHSALPPTQKIILCCQITAFGGLSALAQTKSVMESTGLSLVQYSLSKLLCAFLATLPLVYVL